MAATITGTEGDDRLSGTGTDDTLQGLGGYDVLYDESGNNLLEGGEDNDSFLLFKGQDTIDGGPGTDTLTVDQYAGPLTLDLAAGTGSTRYSTLVVSGVENVGGSGAADSISGSDASNRLDGSGGADTLRGGSGDDTLIGGESVSGAQFDGGSGVDWVDLHESMSPLIIDLSTGVISVAMGPLGTIVGVENLVGTYGGCKLIGDAGDNWLKSAGSGPDTLAGGMGNDTLEPARDGTCIVDGGDGEDTLWFAQPRATFQLYRSIEGVLELRSLTGPHVLASNIEWVRFWDVRLSWADILASVSSAGDDSLIGTSGDDSIQARAGNDTLSGLDGNDLLAGDSGNDSLVGGDGNDTLDGGAGSDTMEGGPGWDHYVVDSPFDQVATGAGSGSAEVTFSVPGTFVYTGHMTHIAVAPSSIAINVVGDDGANSINGNNAPNEFIGLGGNDSLYGGAGDDTLDGGDGADTLNGGAGADVMRGGTGDDTYCVDSKADVVDEAADVSAGTDTVIVDAGYAGTYLLADGIENGSGTAVSGNAAANVLSGTWLSGGGGNDTLYGTSAADSLMGGDGDDTIDAGAGADSVDGGAGDDVLVVHRASSDYTFVKSGTTDLQLLGAFTGEAPTVRDVEWVLFTDGLISVDVLKANATGVTDAEWSGTSGADTITGLAGNDTLHGLEGNDTLIGGAGNDSLLGGPGNDLYDVDAWQDVVVELPGEGMDRVNVGIATPGTWLLPAEVENASVTSPATVAVNLAGNAYDNLLVGNGAANLLSGGAGNDTLAGAAGADTLAGGAGDDWYELSDPSDVVDESSPGSAGHDTLNLSNAAGGTYTLAAGVEDATARGALGIFTINGNGLDNLIVAGNWGATLSGGDGNDTLDVTGGFADGGAGTDTLVLPYLVYHPQVFKPNATDLELRSVNFSETIRNIEYIQFSDRIVSVASLAPPSTFADTIAGTSGNDTIDALAGNDSVLGLEGNDYLDGGTGNDTLVGGPGDDVYIVDATGDVVIEAAGGGNDTVWLTASSGTFVLAANIENGVPWDGGQIGNLGITGNGNDNRLTGNAGANVLSGLDGNDSLYGFTGNDSLVGGNGNDSLDGAQGTDTLAGGAGDDVYWTEDWTADVIDETSTGSGGIDTLHTSVTRPSMAYALPAGVEIGYVTLYFNDTLAGNALDNLILVTADGGNLIAALDGNDTIAASNWAEDTIDGGNGIDALLVDGLSTGLWGVIRVSATDTAFASSGTHVIMRSVEAVQFNDTVVDMATLLSHTLSEFDDRYIGTAGADTIDGLAGNDTLIGMDGDDSLVGSTGKDSLVGGPGNDDYDIDHLGDVIVENPGEGNDRAWIHLPAAGIYVLAPEVEDATVSAASALVAIGIAGNARDNVLTGNAAPNNLSGGAGNDTLDGGLGVDTMSGGTGDDVFFVGPGADVVVENANEGLDRVELQLTAAGTYILPANVENLVVASAVAVKVTGNASANAITGNALADVLAGGAGNDTLVGWCNDTLDGGADVDTAVVAGNLVDYTVTRPTATDVVLSGLGEVLILRGIETVAFADQTVALTQLIAGTPSPFNDTLAGTPAADFLNGFAGADNVTGGEGDDTLVGGAGNDALNGQNGSDLYLVTLAADHALAEVADTGASGVDELRFATVATSGSLNVFAGDTGLERVVIGTGSGATADTTGSARLAVNASAARNGLEIVGNAGANTLTGTAFDDTLDGGGGGDRLVGGNGNDTYLVDNAADAVSEGSMGGNDIVIANVNVVLAANVENLRLAGTAVAGTGNAIGNSIVGNAAANVLDGKAGVDILDGGEGSDLYIVGLASDHQAAEFADTGSAGVDEVRFASNSASTLVLFAGDTGIERVVIGTGTAATAVSTGTRALNVNASAVGDALTIVGNAGANILTGTAADDTLAGGAGNDTLTGGGGADAFVFNTLPNAGSNKDTITDFAPGIDTLRLSRAVFAALGADGTLDPSAFWSGAGTAAGHDADDRLVYNTTTGALYYDADGAGGIASVQIALLGAATHPALNASDIQVVG